MIGTMSAPPFTGKVPPSTKQFCTSVTISAALASGLIVSAARAAPAKPRATLEARNDLRDRPTDMGCIGVSAGWGGGVYCCVPQGTNPGSRTLFGHPTRVMIFALAHECHRGPSGDK